MSYGRGDFGGPGFTEGASYSSPGSVSGMPNGLLNFFVILVT